MPSSEPIGIYSRRVIFVFAQKPAAAMNNIKAKS